MTEVLLFLAITLSSANFQLELAKHYAEHRDFHQSNILLKAVENQFPRSPEFFFRKAVNHFSLGEREATLYYLNLLEQEESVPTRFIVLAALMQAEAKLWQDKDLAETGRLMQISKDRLANAYGGPITQEIQRKIVKNLDRLIKEKEDAQAQANSSGDGKGKQDNVVPQGARSPMEDSQIAGVSGKGILETRPLRKLSDNWGSLPERERQKMLQDLTQALPPLHREAVENYFRNIAKTRKRN